MAEKKESKQDRATFKAVRSYPYGNPDMVGSEVLRNNISTGVHFKDAEGGDKKAREYAAEMQRETRGMRKGGTASSRADGCAVRGKTRGKIV